MATATSTETIYCYGEVGADFSDTDVVRQIEHLSDVDAIDVRLNTAGGSVTAGLAIFDAMKRARRRGQQITTYNDGACLSMGAILLQGGGLRVVADNSLTMLHLPWSPNGGNSDELRKTAETLDKVADELVAIIVDRSSQPSNKVASWLQAETWFSAQEAVDAGLADRRASELPLAARARAASVNVLANYRVPGRYAIAARAPIERVLSELQADVRSASRTAHYDLASRRTSVLSSALSG